MCRGPSESVSTLVTHMCGRGIAQAFLKCDKRQWAVRLQNYQFGTGSS